jgi:chromosome partitioning protein
MITISLINIKGGVGKTMTTLNLAGELCKRGKVLLIDNDNQASLTQIINLDYDLTMLDLYTNKKVSFDDCIVEFKPNISMICNSIDSAILERQLYGRTSRETVLKHKFENMEREFDFVLIDNSPFLGSCVDNSLVMSDYYIEVIDDSPSALKGLKQVKNVVGEISDSGLNEVKLLGILRNGYEKLSNYGKQFNNVLTDVLTSELFDTVVYRSVKYKEATAKHKLIQDYSNEHAEPYIRLVDEILQRTGVKL